jgi:hypothetical protein
MILMLFFMVLVFKIINVDDMFKIYIKNQLHTHTHTTTSPNIFMPFLVHSGPRHFPGGKKKMSVITVDGMFGNI